MARRILLTGASGFIGTHLLPLLQANLHPLDTIAVASRSNIDDLNGITHRHVDLTDGGQCDDLIASTAPDIVIHLAGSASVGGSVGSELTIWQHNVMATLCLAAAVRRVNRPSRFVFASSAEVYGRAFLSEPLASETAVPDPISTYGHTKLAAEYLLRDVLGAAHEIVLLRLFNSLGPNQDERFVAGAFAAQIARMERGEAEPVLRVGNLKALRDFIDVRDTTRAIQRVAMREEAWPMGTTILNVASGNPRSIESLLADFARSARVTFETVVDPERLRPSEIARAAGDASALERQTGWRPAIDWDQTIGDTLTWWRDELGRRA
jgi:GDP-4-dehydro-6-deoxy-D-mannose reductase